MLVETYLLGLLGLATAAAYHGGRTLRDHFYLKMWVNICATFGILMSRHAYTVRTQKSVMCLWTRMHRVRTNLTIRYVLCSHQCAKAMTVEDVAAGRTGSTNFDYLPLSSLTYQQRASKRRRRMTSAGLNATTSSSGGRFARLQRTKGLIQSDGRVRVRIHRGLDKGAVANHFAGAAQIRACSPNISSVIAG